MSGPLVGLVNEHGPRDLPTWAVLVVIAEDQRGPFRHSTLTDAEIGRRARLGRTATKKAIKRAFAEGWLSGRRGTNKGVASSYMLRLFESPFPYEAADEAVRRCLKGSRGDPFDDEDPQPKGSRGDPFEGQRGHEATLKGSRGDPPSVSVQTPYPTPHDEPAAKGSRGDPFEENERDTDFQTAILVDASTPVADRQDAKALVDKLRAQAAAGKANGRASGAAATRNAERLAAAAESPAFDAFRSRRRRTS